MDILSNTFDSRYGTAFGNVLTSESLRQRAPAVFASAAHERTSAQYTFIPTEKVLDGLMGAAFVPVDARQARSRRASPQHGRHVVRLRRRYETVQLRDAIPEIVFLNSHDGTSAYQLRMGLHRVVCTNGLIVSQGAFRSIRVAHRGDVVDEVVAGALAMAEGFLGLAAQVERMEQMHLDEDQQLQLAQRALSVRYPHVAEAGLHSSQLLSCRREADAGSDLWSVFNRIQL